MARIGVGGEQEVALPLGAALSLVDAVCAALGVDGAVRQHEAEVAAARGEPGGHGVALDGLVRDPGW